MNSKGLKTSKTTNHSKESGVFNVVNKVAKINRDTLDLLLLDEKFQKEINDIRDTIGIKLGWEDARFKEWYNKAIDDGRFFLMLKKAKELLPLYGLSDNFKNSIVNYIMFDDYISVPASNFGIDFSGENIQITIYQRLTKKEWEFVKKEVNIFLDLSYKKKFKFLAKFNYPSGVGVKKPKPKLFKHIGMFNDLKKGYTPREVEATWFGDDDELVLENQSKKNVNNIKVIKHRLKKTSHK